MGKLFLSFIWHNHQPYYKDPYTGKFALPWVRLHATKDYLDMLLLKQKYPKIKATFNMVPSLIRQLQEYGEGNTDYYLDVTLKEAESLSEDEKAFILQNFFKADFTKKISKFPRYAELYAKRFSHELGENVSSWAINELRDLQVLFNLSWIDPLYYEEYPELRYIAQKERDFTHEDVRTVIDIQMRIMKRLVDDYKQANINGEVDLIFSPYYHPILPLLYDTRSARDAKPDVALPNLVFHSPGDAKRQLEKGWAQHVAFFGKPPTGFWPSEESVSTDVLDIAAQTGVSWAVTDERILAKSLGMEYFKRGYKDVPEQAQVLYSPYKLPLNDGREITLVFRDQVLSDLIGFEYAKWSADAAVSDFMSRLETIYRKIEPLQGDYLVTVALDGENCWEYYDDDGYDFLSALYNALSNVDWVTTETVGNFISVHDNNLGKLEKMKTGSWIYANFDMWIGDPLKNKAWDYLTAVKHAADLVLRKGTNTDEIAEQVEEQLLIAEGSDWFWWYGKPNESVDKPVFDELFRNNLKKVYSLLDEPIPEFLNEPIS